MRARWLLLLLVVGCQDPDDSSFRGDFRIKLVDAPAAYDAVNIVVRRVSIHRAGAGSSFGWTVISEDVKTFDLLDLRNGVSATLASASLPVGRYDKVLVLYGISNLIEDGFERTVAIPDDLKDGAIVDVDLDVTEGDLAGLTFDMDVTRSIRTTADGRFELRPVIRVQRTDLAGSIAGGVVPDSVLAIVSTIAGGDSVSTFSLALPGINSFQLVDLPEGTYQVGIRSSHPGYLDTVVAGVLVVPRQTTQLGAIELRPRPILP
jgi:hypothetical protein